MSQRIVHFGIDGGSLGVLDGLASRGVMPEYDALRREAGSATLRSTLPWFTVPAWITWMTGVPAERHGLIYWTATSAHEYWDRTGANRRFVTFTDIRDPTVFRLASDAGVRVASVNMPVTFPPPVVDGVMIAGFGSPPNPERAAHPRGFLRRYPDYRIDIDDSVANVLGTPRARAPAASDDDVTSYADRLASMAEARHRVFIDLLQDVGFASIVYVGADRLSHVAWPHVEAVLAGKERGPAEQAVARYYSTLDRLLGETRRAAADALFVVSSDHGQGPPPPREIAINAWLKERGWLTMRGSRIRKAARLGTASIRRRLWSAWRRISNVPTGAAPLVDWHRTVAYGIAMSHCRIFGIALEGNRALRDEVVDALREFTDPDTGVRPIRRVLLADEICEGHGRTTFPDILAILRDEYGATGKVDGPAVRPTAAGPSGYHEPDGLLLAAGPGVDPGPHPAASIADIAPTLLAGLGLEPLPSMKGSVLPWIVESGEELSSLDPATETANPDGLTAQDEDLITSHLRDLGYVD